MFSNLNMWEILVLLLLALFIFGPERLPKVIGDAARMLRNLRNMARNATSDLSRELGTEVTLEDLHPRTFLRKHLLSEEEEAQLRRPFDDVLSDVKQLAADVNEHAPGRPRPEPPGLPGTPPGLPGTPDGGGYGQSRPYGAEYQPDGPATMPRRYDEDAT
jgi:sec-independent protein translocase protein TatB